MLLHTYEIFSSLLGHLQFFVHFFFTFKEQLQHPVTKILSLGAIAMISTDRKLLEAVITPFSCHLPENKKTGHFWPFFHHLYLLMGNPLIPPLLLLTKIISPGDAAKVTMERKLLQSIMPPLSSPYLPFY